MPAQPKNIGLIGLSATGSWAAGAHLGHLLETPHYKISALQNSSEAAAKKAAETYKLDSVSTHGSITSLVQDPNVDIVAVSVNVPQHFGLTAPAIQAGKDVFVEWPLAKNLSEAEALVELAREKGVRTLVGLQGRQQPAVRKAKELVEGGKLGRILATRLDANVMFMGDPTLETMTVWLDEENGANVLTITGGHALDALAFVLGEMDSVNAVFGNLRPKIKIVDREGKVVRVADKTSPDHVAVQGTLVSGGVVSAMIVGGTERVGPDFFWEINGTEGTLLFESANGAFQVFAPTLKFKKNEPGAELEEIKLENAEGYDWATGKAWDVWAGAGEGPLVTFEEALVRQRMMDAVIRSAKESKTTRYL